MGFLKSPVFIACMLVFSMALCCNAQNSRQDFLDAHNAARAAVGVGPMTWDTTVEAYAQNYANRRAADCSLTHSGSFRFGYGENIAAGGGPLTAKSAVAMWDAEKRYYHHASNSCSAPAGQSCGHYTQVVWRKSVKLGCARVKCANGAGHFVTCNYSPPGNFNNEIPY
ncbi:PREDICTED: pathogenesis-related protein 1A-like [Ipomoea nil]|uniref:pathogenesis-related protein 1A-like n=1 Tax=Ipomoea nil TaxID=35883 RepID=UPI0009011827|nr:PREDICTED: pathogenesis-related protein 1A-like [Ipomoea nil]XP_019170406.1 PREDICTED: pathogenesis-related protein 1A-like [Ipomoea nil]